MVVANKSIVLVGGYDLAVVVHRERISVGMLLIDAIGGDVFVGRNAHP